MPRPRIGLTLPQIGAPYAEVLEITRLAEGAGFDGVFLFDHLWPLGARHRPILECWMTLAALTQATERVHLGTLVTRVTVRNPGLLAKMAATIDQIGGGRLILGLGAGDDLNRQENEAYGLPFYDRAHRETSLREAIIVIDRLWRERDPSFSGEIYRLQEATLEPKPVRRPRPPIWVGGRSAAARRVAADLADGWNLWGSSRETFAAGVRDLRDDARQAGRDPAAIAPTWAGNIIVAENRAALEAAVERYRPKSQRAEVFRGQIVAGDPAECAEQIAAFVAAGAEWVICDFPGTDKRAAVELFAERVLPRL